MFQSPIITCAECPVLKKSMFHSIPEKNLNRVDMIKHTLNYQKSELIFHANDPSNSFYCMQRGSVQIFRNSPSREQSFSIVGPGAWIGFRDALLSVPYQHTTKALIPVRVCKISRDILPELLVHHPPFVSTLMNHLSAGWIESERQSYNLGARKTIERLADFLLNLKENQDASTNLTELNFPLTRETIASLIGTTTESVIRTLSEFKARGWIEIHDGKIKLIKEKELEKLVQES